MKGFSLRPLADDPDFRRHFRAWVLAAATAGQPDLPHWNAMLRIIEVRRPRRAIGDVWRMAAAAEADHFAAELGWSTEERAAFISAVHDLIEQLLREDVYGVDERGAYEAFYSVARAVRLDQPRSAGGP